MLQVERDTTADARAPMFIPAPKKDAIRKNEEEKMKRRWMRSETRKGDGEGDGDGGDEELD